jgi:hypothetical protein
LTIKGIQIMEDSPLFGDAPPPEAPPPEAPPSQPKGKFGNLRANAGAKGRRDLVKFFDSADWAMKKQGEAGDAPNPATDSPPQPALASFTQGDAEPTPLAEGSSDSPLAGGE